MKRTICLNARLLVTILLLSLTATAQDLQQIELPKADTAGGKPLMEALKLRRSTRSFGPEKLSTQVLSNLLWAAFGINRPDGHRTAPSAMNWQEIDIYVAMEEGLYMYDAKSNILKPILKQDLREKTGTQAFVK